MVLAQKVRVALIAGLLVLQLGILTHGIEHRLDDSRASLCIACAVADSANLVAEAALPARPTAGRICARLILSLPDIGSRPADALPRAPPPSSLS